MSTTLDELREELSEYKEKIVAVKGGLGLMGCYITLRALEIADRDCRRRTEERVKELEHLRVVGKPEFAKMAKEELARHKKATAEKKS